MLITDTIGDMLIRIKNAYMVRHSTVLIPHSKMIERILEILKENGYIDSFSIENKQKSQPDIVVKLRYIGNIPAISGVKRISKPSRRFYVSAKKIPRVLNGHGIVIVSTNKGVITGKEAKKLNVGGELVCSVW